MFPLPGMIVSSIGRYEKEALIRERNGLWADRFRLTSDQGRRLDELLRRFGPVESYNPYGLQQRLSELTGQKP